MANDWQLEDMYSIGGLPQSPRRSSGPPAPTVSMDDLMNLGALLASAAQRGMAATNAPPAPSGGFGGGGSNLPAPSPGMVGSGGAAVVPPEQVGMGMPWSHWSHSAPPALPPEQVGMGMPLSHLPKQEMAGPFVPGIPGAAEALAAKAMRDADIYAATQTGDLRKFAPVSVPFRDKEGNPISEAEGVDAFRKAARDRLTAQGIYGGGKYVSPVRRMDGDRHRAFLEMTGQTPSEPVDPRRDLNANLAEAQERLRQIQAVRSPSSQEELDARKAAIMTHRANEAERIEPRREAVIQRAKARAMAKAQEAIERRRAQSSSPLFQLAARSPTVAAALIEAQSRGASRDVQAQLARAGLNSEQQMRFMEMLSRNRNAERQNTTADNRLQLMLEDMKNQGKTRDLQIKMAEGRDKLARDEFERRGKIAEGQGLLPSAGSSSGYVIPKGSEKELENRIFGLKDRRKTEEIVKWAAEQNPPLDKGATNAIIRRLVNENARIDAPSGWSNWWANRLDWWPNNKNTMHSDYYD